MKLSVSQIKKYIKSPAERAGCYILGIWSQDEYVATTVGKACHKYMETGDINDGLLLIAQSSLSDEQKEEARIKMYIWIGNISHANLTKKYEKKECKVDCTICDVPFVAIIDAMDDEEIIDYKTATYHTKQDGVVNMRSAMSSRDEYELQAWIYMQATGIKTVKFIEALTAQYKKYRPDEHYQIITHTWSDEFSGKMEAKYKPIINEIVGMYERYKSFIK